MVLSLKVQTDSQNSKVYSHVYYTFTKIRFIKSLLNSFALYHHSVVYLNSHSCSFNSIICTKNSIKFVYFILLFNDIY